MGKRNMTTVAISGIDKQQNDLQNDIIYHTTVEKLGSISFPDLNFSLKLCQ
jgi:hypothetical protein